MANRPRAARAATVLVVVVLCCFSAVSFAAEEEEAEQEVSAAAGVASSASKKQPVEAASTVKEGAARKDDPEDDDPPLATSGNPGAAQRLSIATGPDDQYPFRSAGDDERGNGNPDEVIYEEEDSAPRFSCGSGATLAVEPLNVAMRRFSIWMTKASAGFLDSVMGTGDDQEPDVWVTDGQLNVFSEDGTKGSPVLLAALEQPLPNGTRIEAGEERGRNRELAVQYDCRQDGKAIVELKLRVEASDRSSDSVCLRWVKQCKTGFSTLQIEHGDNVVVADGQLQDDWVQRMTKEGTNQEAVKFTISAEGLEQIRTPTVSSDQKLVSVELLGPMAWNERSEVSTEPIDLTVSFTCLFDGFAMITLGFEKETFSGDEPERLEIKFRKVCGVEAYSHLDVFIKSEKYKNKTKAYSQGAVIPGFARPCKGAESQAMSQALAHHQDRGQHCHSGSPALVISKEELRTVVLLEVDRLSESEPPRFEPVPDITYDRKLMRVQILQAPTGGQALHRANGKSHRSSAKSQTLSLKYFCHKDGESTVMVTLHVLAHKKINLAWTKKCAEPKATHGKAFTAPQALMVTMFVCGGLCVIGLVIYWASNKKKDADVFEPSFPKKKGYKHTAHEDDDGSHLELANKVGRDQEVVYHS